MSSCFWRIVGAGTHELLFSGVVLLQDDAGEAAGAPFENPTGR